MRIHIVCLDLSVFSWLFLLQCGFSGFSSKTPKSHWFYHVNDITGGAAVGATRYFYWCVSSSVSPIFQSQGLSTLETIVADFGDNLSPKTATVAEFGDYSRQCGQAISLFHRRRLHAGDRSHGQNVVGRCLQVAPTRVLLGQFLKP